MKIKTPIKRAYYETIKKLITPGKALFIVGPRRAGKTTFLTQIINTQFRNKKVKTVTGDNITTQQVLSTPDLAALKEFISNYEVLAIDEVQLIPNVGATLKLILDHFPNLYILATGSASLEITHKVGEPLVGRKFTITLYPFAMYELRRYFFNNDYELKENLPSILIYGTYPEVLLASNTTIKRALLQELVGSYIFRDILQLEKLKYPFLLERLLKLLAYQIGSTVSYNELANELGIDVKTVQKYLWLLQKSYIIVQVPNYTRNKRNELKKSKKYYFVDLGIRNAVLNDFSEFNLRPDKGALWENFIFMERLKKHSILLDYTNMYFWRTKTKQEIDLIEEKDGRILPYGLKLTNSKAKSPKAFKTYYPDAQRLTVINENNFLDFIA